MNSSTVKNYMKAIIVALCILVLILVILIAISLDKKPTDNDSKGETTAIGGTEQSDKSPESSGQNNDPEKNPEDETTAAKPEETQPDEIVTPPEELPNIVVIPTDKNEQTGENQGISFPCQIPEYNITLERMANYTGMFVESGLNLNNMNVAMLLVKNNSAYSVEYMSISVEFENETLVFDITAFPKGESMVVQEKTGKAMPDSKPISCKALVVTKADMGMAEGVVSVKDNGDNTITVQNLTDKAIPTVRIFYKYYMEEENLYVGGIAFTVRLSRLQANGKVTLQPSHYTSGSCKIVMVLTYDEEL